MNESLRRIREQLAGNYGETPDPTAALMDNANSRWSSGSNEWKYVVAYLRLPSWTATRSLLETKRDECLILAYSG